jgi:AcrR family transcriptional regulator
MFRPSARERILDEGLKLACTGGLCRVTFGAIAQRASVSKSGIVAHFSNADRLKAAIIARAIDVWGHTCLVRAEDLSGLAELTRYLSSWISWTKRAGLPGGCPIAAAMFEYDSEQSSVRVAIAAAEALWRATLVELIEGAIAGSGFSHSVDPSQMAWNLLGVYLSHHVSCHFLRAPDADQRALASVDQLIAFAKRPPERTR